MKAALDHVDRFDRLRPGDAWLPNPDHGDRRLTLLLHAERRGDLISGLVLVTFADGSCQLNAFHDRVGQDAVRPPALR